MSFRFAGIFATAGVDALADLLREYPDADGRPVTQPFDGIALQLPLCSTDTPADPPADLPARHAAQAATLRQFARRYPDAAWVYIEVAPHADRAVYSRVALRGDTVLCDLPPGAPAPTAAPPQRRITGQPLATAPAALTTGLPADFPHTLAALVAPLGVKLRTGYFAPFSLRFWAAQHGEALQ